MEMLPLSLWLQRYIWVIKNEGNKKGRDWGNLNFSNDELVKLSSDEAVQSPLT